MSVTGADLAWRGSTGGTEWGRGERQLAIWRVLTNSALDQSLTVLEWFYANRVAKGDAYAFANDAALGIGPPIAKRIFAERELKSNHVWLVFVEYDNDNQDVDASGDPTDDPLSFRATISEQTVQYTKALTKATYVKGFSGDAEVYRVPGSVGPVQNSAGIPVLPPPEVEDSRVVVRIGRPAALIAATAHDDMINAVNLTSFTIDHFGYLRFVPAKTARIREITVGLRRENNTDFWEKEVHLDIFPDTWRLKIYDLGLVARAAPGDPDGNGGTLSQSDMVTGVPQYRQILDKDGNPITDPVPLNGNGQPAVPGAAPVQIEYIQYPKEREFRNYTFFSGLIT